jgi:hypothetical protein
MLLRLNKKRKAEFSLVPGTFSRCSRHIGKGREKKKHMNFSVRWKSQEIAELSYE